MKDLEVRLIKNKKEMQAVLKVREIVFIKEQKVPRHLDLDGLDKEARHVLVSYKNRPVGCARIRFIGKKAKLERLALLKRYRGMGFGKAITEYLISYCKKKKVKEIILHSQYYLKDFYGKLGFKPRGKTFMEAGIKHIEMYLKPIY